MPVLLWQWHTGDVSTSAERPLPRAARGTCCACWGHLCAVVLAGPDLHGLAGFPPLVPDLKRFRWSLEWLSSKLAVRRCLLNPVLPLPMPSAPRRNRHRDFVACASMSARQSFILPMASDASTSGASQRHDKDLHECLLNHGNDNGEIGALAAEWH